MTPKQAAMLELDMRIASLVRKGEVVAAIRERLGVSDSRVYEALRRLGVTQRNGREGTGNTMARAGSPRTRKK